MALVGPAWAAEILFSARRLSDAEALRMGLVNRVVPADELEGAVQELAGQMAANAPLTIRACKAAIHELLRDPARRDLEPGQQAGRGVLPLRGLPGGPAGLHGEAPPAVQGPLTGRPAHLRLLVARR